MRFHRKAAGQLEALWAAWGRAGLVGRIRTYEGSYTPRFVRGRPGRLSSHAYAHGFFWGGHFKGRPDGMHFEVAKLL